MEQQLIEMKRLVEEAGSVPNFTWKATVWAGGELIPVLKVLSVTNNRVFDTHFGDELMISLSITGGVLMHDLLPNKDVITVSLERVSGSKTTGQPVATGQANTFTYNAVLEYTGNELMSGNPTLEYKTTADNDFTEVHLQLVEPILEHTRTSEINGIFRRCTVKDVLQYYLGPLTGAVGIDLVEPDNKQVYEQIIIPPTVKLINLVDYLQTTSGYGIYTTGAGCYLAKGFWYVWPLYNIVRYGNIGRALTITSYPPNMFPELEHTFFVRNSQVFVLSTGKVNVLDESEINQLQEGNGVRYLNADTMLESFGKTSKNIFTPKRSINMIEYNKLARRDDKSVSFMSPRKTTANHCREASFISRRQGQMLTVEWENSLPDVLNPGMPVKFSYAANGTTESIHGVILRVSDHSSQMSTSMNEITHTSKTTISLFMERKEK